MTIAPEILYVVGVAILGLVMAGVFLYVRGRNKANDVITEVAAHELKRNPERYEAQTKKQLEAEIRR